MSDTTRRFGAKLLAPQNLISVLVGVAVFLAGLRLWNTTAGVAVSALAAALLSGLVWVIWWFAKGPPAAAKALETTHLGEVPAAPGAAPTLLDAASPASARYRDLIATIQGHTTGQVLLVSSSGPLAGPSSVPLNLAVAATQLGRRTVLIDGDLGGDGLFPLFEQRQRRRNRRRRPRPSHSRRGFTDVGHRRRLSAPGGNGGGQS